MSNLKTLLFVTNDKLLNNILNSKDDSSPFVLATEDMEPAEIQELLVCNGITRVLVEGKQDYFDMFLTITKKLSGKIIVEPYEKSDLA